MKVAAACNEYFRGFQDLRSCKQNKAAINVLAILKILSYFTVILPLCFGAVYGIASLAGRVSKKSESTLSAQDRRVSGAVQPVLQPGSPTVIPPSPIILPSLSAPPSPDTPPPSIILPRSTNWRDIPDEQLSSLTLTGMTREELESLCHVEQRDSHRIKEGFGDIRARFGRLSWSQVQSILPQIKESVLLGCLSCKQFTDEEFKRIEEELTSLSGQPEEIYALFSNRGILRKLSTNLTFEAVNAILLKLSSLPGMKIPNIQAHILACIPCDQLLKFDLSKLTSNELASLFSEPRRSEEILSKMPSDQLNLVLPMIHRDKFKLLPDARLQELDLTKLYNHYVGVIKGRFSLFSPEQVNSILDRLGCRDLPSITDEQLPKLDLRLLRKDNLAYLFTFTPDEAGKERGRGRFALLTPEQVQSITPLPSELGWLMPAEVT